jgi:hypothetical protein
MIRRCAAAEDRAMAAGLSPGTPGKGIPRDAAAAVGCGLGRGRDDLRGYVLEHFADPGAALDEH